MKSCRLGDIAFITKLAGFEHTKYIQGNCVREKVDDTFIPLFIGKTIRDGKIDTNFDWYISKKIADKLPRSFLKRKCLVLPYVGSLGDLAIFDASYEALLGSNVAKIELNQDCEFTEEFIYYFLKSPYGQSVLLKDEQGGIQKNITMESIRNVILPDISVSNQKKITDVLSALDDKIALNQRINRNLEELARLIYDYWFVQFDFPDKNGKPYKTSGGKMVYNDQLKREIPEGWDVKRLGDVCNFRNGINYDKNEAGDKLYKIVNVRNISASSIILNQNDFDEITLNSKLADNYLIPEDSILIARSGCPGATRIIIDVESNVIFCGFIICMDEFDAEYKLYYTLYLKGLENTSATKTGGSILQNVSQETLKRLPIVLPPEDVIASFNKKMHSIFSGQVLTNKEVVELIALRDQLLPLLMNGQVSVEKMP